MVGCFKLMVIFVGGETGSVGGYSKIRSPNRESFVIFLVHLYMGVVSLAFIALYLDDIRSSCFLFSFSLSFFPCF